jgi:hypothetical protein
MQEKSVATDRATLAFRKYYYKQQAHQEPRESPSVCCLMFYGTHHTRATPTLFMPLWWVVRGFVGLSQSFYSVRTQSSRFDWLPHYHTPLLADSPTGRSLRMVPTLTCQS